MDKFNGIPLGGKILYFPKKPVRPIPPTAPEGVEPFTPSIDWKCSLDALKNLVYDIENGLIATPDMIYIAMRCSHPTEKDTYMFPRYMWGPPSPGASLLFSGLLHQHLKRL